MVGRSRFTRAKKHSRLFKASPVFGFLISADNNQEAQAVSEFSQKLGQFAIEYYNKHHISEVKLVASEENDDDDEPPEKETETDSLKSKRLKTENEDSEKKGHDLQKAQNTDVVNSGENKVKRVEFIDTGCKGLLVARFLDLNLDPNKFARLIFESFQQTSTHTTEQLKKRKRNKLGGLAEWNFTARLLPFLVACEAKTEEIVEHVRPLIAQYLPPDQPKKYAIQIQRRNNSSVSREETIREVGKLVSRSHSVDLQNPDIVILIEVIKSACLLGISEDYHKFHTYSFHQMRKLKKGEKEGEKEDEKEGEKEGEKEKEQVAKEEKTQEEERKDT